MTQKACLENMKDGPLVAMGEGWGGWGGGGGGEPDIKMDPIYWTIGRGGKI